jgi:hypothetical protein
MAVGPCAFELACHYTVESDGKVGVLVIVSVCSEPVGPGAQWHFAYVEDHARLRHAHQTKFTNETDLAYINQVLQPRTAEMLPRMARVLDAVMRVDHRQSLTLSVRIRLSRVAHTFSGGGEVHTSSTEWLRWGGSAPELRPACAAHPDLAGVLTRPGLLDELERPALLSIFAGTF